jgi:hypothetical protein
LCYLKHGILSNPTNCLLIRISSFRTYDLFEDPVATSDGHRYERSAITKWFQIRKSSPLTGLQLNDTTLSTDRKLTKDVHEWVDGIDLVSSTQDSLPKKKRRMPKGSEPSLNVQFVSRQGMFQRSLHPDASLSTLYEVAFRGLRGRYAEFDLSLDGEIHLPATKDSSIASNGILNNSQVQVILPTASKNGKEPLTNSRTPSDTDLCLVKVYGLDGQLCFGCWVPQSTETSKSISSENIIFVFFSIDHGGIELT